MLSQFHTGPQQAGSRPEPIAIDRLLAYARRCAEKAETCRSAGLPSTAAHFYREALDAYAEIVHRQRTCKTQDDADHDSHIVEMKTYLIRMGTKPAAPSKPIGRSAKIASPSSYGKLYKRPTMETGS